MREPNVELDRDRMEQLRNQARDELVDQYHQQKMLARAARKCGNPTQASSHQRQVDYLYKMITALDTPITDDADTHLQEAPL